MKNKINIMNKRQEITDEEIERFKDFDSLLLKHRQLTTGGGLASWMKWTGAVTVAGATLFSVYYFIKQEEPVAVKTEQIQALQENIPAKDSVTANETISTEETSNQEVVPLTSPSSTESKTKENVAEEKQVSTEKPNEEVRPVPVYVLAEPVNGYANLYEYFNRELIYPKEAVKDSIQGVLTVSFVIDRTGKVGNLEYINSLGKPFEAEAARLITNMPAWKPATLNGDPVPSKMSLPLTFQIHVVVEKNK